MIILHLFVCHQSGLYISLVCYLACNMLVLILLLVFIEINHLIQLIRSAFRCISFDFLSLLDVGIRQIHALGVKHLHPFRWKWVAIIVILIWEVDIIILIEVQLPSIIHPITKL